jgi:uncharacterized protein (DUF1015 family)
MAKITALRFARPPKEFVNKVASYPYDIVNTEEAAKLVAGNPLSFLHVTKSQVDLPPDTDQYSRQVYDLARQRLCDFMKQGILVRDSKPGFYLYCQKLGSHEQCGLVAGVHVSDFESDLVKAHESTLEEKLVDRTRHIEVVEAQTGPIFLTYRHKESIDRFTAVIRKRLPVYDFQTEDGVAHIVWQINDPGEIEFLEKEFEQVKHIYIADGHHRAASALNVARHRAAKLAGSGAAGGAADFVFSVLFPDNSLNIISYNRVVKDLNGLDVRVFLEALGSRFKVIESPHGMSPRKNHEIGMYLKGTWYLLEVPAAVLSGRDALSSLDTSLLQECVLSPILGIADPRTDRRIRFVGGSRGTKELERLVDSGEFAVAFQLYPTTISQVMEVADEGKIMPPKSTWFEPKLRDGIFVHLIK